MSVAVTTIVCASPADGVRLSQVLARPGSWSGTMPSIEGNGALVTLTWSLPVSTTAIQAAVAAAKPAVMTAVSVTHTAAGAVTAFRF